MEPGPPLPCSPPAGSIKCASGFDARTIASKQNLLALFNYFFIQQNAILPSGVRHPCKMGWPIWKRLVYSPGLNHIEQAQQTMRIPAALIKDEVVGLFAQSDGLTALLAVGTASLLSSVLQV